MKTTTAELLYFTEDDRERAKHVDEVSALCLLAIGRVLVHLGELDTFTSDDLDTTADILGALIDNARELLGELDEASGRQFCGSHGQIADCIKPYGHIDECVPVPPARSLGWSTGTTPDEALERDEREERERELPPLPSGGNWLPIA